MKKIIPIIIYNNMENKKDSILKDNKNKSGIYRITNLVNNKIYIGSSIDLKKRFLIYYNKNRLINSNMIIYKAILKYNYVYFKLEILDYCSQNVLLAREQYYIDILKPEYNILKVAGSSLGYKHSQKTLELFRNREFSIESRFNLSKSAKGRILSEQARSKISLARKGKMLSQSTIAKLSLIGTIREGVEIEVKNIITDELKKYINITSASLDLGVSRTGIRKAIKEKRILKGIYIIKKITKN